MSLQEIIDNKPRADTVQEIERAEINDPYAKAEALVAEEPKRKWVSYIWDSLDKSPEERRLVFKIDCALLTFACIGEKIDYLMRKKY